MSWTRYFRREQWDEEYTRELHAHLEIETDDNMVRGMPPEQARHAARLKLGNQALVREEIYQMNSIAWLGSLRQDARYGLRTLTKAPAFALVVIVSLALGIGANTAIFSLINAALLKMLPVESPEQLVELINVSPVWGPMEFSYPAFKEFRDRNQVFAGVLAFFEFGFAVDVEVNGHGDMAKAQVVSGNYFSVLGIQPAVGRLITPTDETEVGENPVAVIGYEYWRKRFALNPEVLGQKITLNNTPLTVIGVTPPEFFGLQPGERIDVSVPITMIGQLNPGLARIGTRYDILAAPFNRWLHVMARLNPGITHKAATANLEPLYRESLREAAASLSGLPFDSPATRRSYLTSRLQLVSAEHGLAALRQRFSKPLWILMGIVCLLVLVTCANVANLLLARNSARQKEITVRLTVGAGRGRLIRQLITESVLLALSGGVLGVILAFWSARYLLTLASHSGSALHLQVQPDATVLGFALLVSLFTAVLFGLAPAWRATRLDTPSALIESTRSRSGGTSRSSLGKALIVFQVAASLVLLISAGLLVHSLENLKDFYPGFNKDNVLLLSIHPMTVGYKDAETASLYRRLLDRISGIPGIKSTTLAFYSPLTGSWGATVPKIKETTSQSGRKIKPVGLNEVGPNYFTTLQMPLLSGRDFTYADKAGAPKVAIVSQAMAHQYFGDGYVLGRHLSVPDWSGDPSWFEIVGVVKDTKNQSLREQPIPAVYLPLFQSPEGLATFEVRTAMAPLSMSDAVQRAIKATDSRLPIFNVTTLNDQVGDSLVQERLVASLSSLFGLLALILAGVGLYGLMTYAVNRRTSEIGIRMALGARSIQIAGMVVGETLQLVLIGFAIGIPAALTAARLIKSELYGLKSDDPITLLVATLILAIIGVAAAYLPARRASRVDPMGALRSE